MPDHLQLKGEVRELLGKKVRRLRRAGVLPATVYGHKVTPLSIQVDAHELGSVLRHAGRTQLIDLMIGKDKARPVFIKQMAVDAKRNLIQHIEFFQANLTEVMISRVALHFTGESPAVKEGGIFIAALDHLDVESLPEEVPAVIEVDSAMITEINGVLHAEQVPLPAGVKLVTPPDELIAKVEPPVAEEVAEAPAALEEIPAEAGAEEQAEAGTEA